MPSFVTSFDSTSVRFADVPISLSVRAKAKSCTRTDGDGDDDVRRIAPGGEEARLLLRLPVSLVKRTINAAIRADAAADAVGAGNVDRVLCCPNKRGQRLRALKPRSRNL